MSNYNVSHHRQAWIVAFIAAVFAALICATTITHAAKPDQQGADDTIPMRDDAPMRYIVQKGDTLWDIAGHFLTKPWYWPELWYTNPDIKNPHLIYPGDVLKLGWRNGKPYLRRVDTVKLEPKVRKEPIDTAIPTIPLEAIKHFLSSSRLVTADQLEDAPYIVQFLDGHLVGGAGIQFFARHANASNGANYSVIHPGDAYRDPDTGKILGYQAMVVGKARIREFDKISTGVLTQAEREVLIGDRLLPIKQKQELASDFYPHAPDTDVHGHIISATHGTGQIGQYNTVAMDLGSNQGIERGHVLTVYQAGETTEDPITGETLTLPKVRAGTVLIFKVADHVSWGLVMDTTRAINLGDLVLTPEQL